MRSLKTIILTLSLLYLPLSAQAERSSLSDQLKQFATCVGQLSAQMEYEWMFDGPASERTEQHRAAMIDLVHAIMTPDQGRQVLSWRIAAKQAHFALLTRGTFNDDPGDAEWALTLAQSNAADCGSMLLS